MDLSEHVVEDYRALRFSLKAHPLSFLRQSLAREGIVEAMQLEVLKPGILVRVAGLVLVRQRPGDSGVIFATLEDETGIANVIIWPAVFERFRAAVLRSQEHTSELQSLMRISYAVFCLTKKKKKHHT